MHRHTLLGFGLALVFAWLVTALRVQALFNQHSDDALFLRNASSLMHLHWLGGYNARTLVKGPGYPMFLALCARSRLPVLFAQSMFYAGACAVFCTAVRPLLRNASWALTLFGVLLFNPVNFSMPRIMRDSFYSSLVLLVLACGIALYLRSDRWLASWWGRWWFVGFAGALGLALITREEGVWFVPALLLLGCGVAAGIVRSTSDWRGRARGLAGLLLLLPLLVFAPTLLTCAANRFAYKRFIVSEMTQPELAAAVGALMRVRSSEENEHLHVSKSSREKLYRVSPAFATLRRSLDADNQGSTCHWLRNVAKACRFIDEREIPGGWFVWSLRAAASSAGEYKSATKAQAFYARIASEVNAACADRRLDCEPGRASLVPPWRSSFLGSIAESLTQSVKFVAAMQVKSASEATSLPSQSSGSAAYDRALWIFSDRVTGFASDNDVSAPPVTAQGVTRLRVLDAILWVYRHLLPWVCLGALLRGSLLVAGALRRRRVDRELFVIAVLGVALATRLVVIATVDALSFPGVNEYYLAPAFPLLLAFCLLSLQGCRTMLASRSSARTAQPRG